MRAPHRDTQGVGDGLVVQQTRFWKFDTAMMQTRVQVMGQRQADMKDRTQHALAYAARENFFARWLQAEVVATLGFKAATIFNEAAELAGQIHASVVPLDVAIAHAPQNANNLPQMVATRTAQLNPYYRACTLLWRSMRLMFGAIAAAQRLYPDD